MRSFTILHLPAAPFCTPSLRPLIPSSASSAALTFGIGPTRPLDAQRTSSDLPTHAFSSIFLFGFNAPVTVPEQIESTLSGHSPRRPRAPVPGWSRGDARQDAGRRVAPVPQPPRAARDGRKVSDEEARNDMAVIGVEPATIRAASGVRLPEPHARELDDRSPGR